MCPFKFKVTNTLIQMLHNYIELTEYGIQDNAVG